ncbi:HAD-IA family hydrolase [Candidatus Woesebacteria bacterium]|nr:HAD-IA family hydrolase [Candidatus Woesebacteria bacterium]
MNLIFDFDGTICDSFNVAIEIFRKNFPEYFSDDITPEYARSIGVKKLIKKTNFPKHLLPKLMLQGSKEMVKIIPRLKTFPKINEVIKKLSKGNVLGIITNNSEENVRTFLKNNDLNMCFDFVYSTSSLFGKDSTIKKVIKEIKLKKKDTIYIGDQTSDVEAAKRVSVRSAAVTWGYEAESVLKKSIPTYIIKKPQELLLLFN